MEVEKPVYVDYSDSLKNRTLENEDVICDSNFTGTGEKGNLCVKVCR